MNLVRRASGEPLSVSDFLKRCSDAEPDLCLLWTKQTASFLCSAPCLSVALISSRVNNYGWSVQQFFSSHLEERGASPGRPWRSKLIILPCLLRSGGNGAKAKQARERAKEKGPKDAKSQLKVNEAAKSIQCALHADLSITSDFCLS